MASGEAPTRPGRRLVTIDILRGFALFGVLLVNMGLFKSTLFYWDKAPGDYAESLNIFFAWSVELLAEGKFYPIFSFLFGLGFYLFAARAKAKGLEAIPLYRRRIFGLLIMGFIHLFFIWSGDILHIYAITGFILLKLSHISDKNIKKLIIVLFCLSLVLQGGIKFSESMVLEGEVETEMGLDPQEERLALKESALSTYQQGNFVEILRFRLFNEVPYVLLNLFFSLPDILFLFLLGLYVGRKKILAEIPHHAGLLKKTLKRCFTVGVSGMIVYYFLRASFLEVTPLWQSSIETMVFYAASISIAVAYIALISLLTQKDLFSKLLHPLSYVGRMALTNYLTQSIICVSLFYGYGAGWFGQVSVVQGVLLTVAIYAVQIFWSWAWLTYYQFGPFEWLWRCFTYQKIFPIKKMAG